MASVLTKTVSVLVSLSLFSFISSAATASDSGKVSLGLYYESLCPYSANFIVNYLAKLYEDDDLFSIVDLHLSPWGNARLKVNGSIVCQHGPFECLLNTVEACAIHAWPKLEEHFPFINCIETLAYERKYPEWQSCFEKLGLDPNPIEDCYSSGLGKKLELQYAGETNDLQPPHQYVPWVVVDGEPLYEDYENFVSYICKAYKGTLTAPKACRELYPYNIRRGKSSPVSYKEKKVSALTERIISGISSLMRQGNEVAST
ncbi:gamma-interferon-responsive lysosomal thiol protein [Euphorbia lathyris]|uniref:gamma-interferon-responsive lysosomal thiol protein n=1 Tax=Euphorbia lathyris TaxID=212925 RepID=UPI003314460E